jgi:hypothetical protein
VDPRPFLTASWRYLAMLNFEVPPALLRPLVPARRTARPLARPTPGTSEVGGHRLEVRTLGRPVVPDPGSEAAFITEHYWGYTRRRDGGTSEYRVAHAPWRVWSTAGSVLDCDVAAVYGAGFAECLRNPPRSAFLAEGSPVTVYRGRRVAARPHQGPQVSFSTPG